MLEENCAVPKKKGIPKKKYKIIFDLEAFL